MRKISRPHTSQTVSRSRQAQARKPAAAESIDAFKRAFATAEQFPQRSNEERFGDSATENHLSTRQLSNHFNELDRVSTDTSVTDAQVEFAGLLAAQDTSTIGNLSTYQPTSGQALAPHLAELIAKHVRKMFVSQPGVGQQAIMLQLNDDSLPGTDLVLLKDDNNWRLEARSDSEDTLNDINDCADDLTQAFVDLDLGRLQIEAINTKPSD